MNTTVSENHTKGFVRERGGIINSRMKIGNKAMGYPYNYPTENPKTQ